MVARIYGIYDTQLERWNIPFYARDNVEAVTILKRCNLPKSILNDTKLFYLGDFRDDNLEVPLVALADKEEINIDFLKVGDQNG